MNWVTTLKARKLPSNFYIVGQELDFRLANRFLDKYPDNLNKFKNIVESLYNKLNVDDVYIPSPESAEDYRGVLMVIFKINKSVVGERYELRISVNYNFNEINIRLIDDGRPHPVGELSQIADTANDFYMGKRKNYTLDNKETIIREIPELVEAYK